MESLRGEGSVPGAEASGVVSRTREVADVSYRAFLEAFDPPRTYWATPDGLEVAGVGAAARLTASGPDRFGDVRDAAAELFAHVDADGPPETRPRAFGGAAFHDSHEPSPPWEDFAAAEFVVPRAQIVRSDGRTYLTVTGTGDPGGVVEDLEKVSAAVAELPAMRPSGGAPGVDSRRMLTSREEWVESVERILSRIDAGEIRKAVLATGLSVGLAERVSTPDVLERLRRTYPECFRFLVQPGETGFFGAPPERLVRLEGQDVRTEALAGSVPRGDTPEADEELASSLLESEKLQREQGMVAEAIEAELSPLGEVRVGDQGIRRLATIQHLQTPIQARLEEETHVLSLVERLHPTPAVGGVPLGPALETIREIEPFDRGWYASPVGWFDAAGDGEFAVGIRSAVGDGETVTMFGGNGIVADSDPAEEWEEVLPKFRPVLDELER